MADTYKWAEALNINAKKLKEWGVLAPDGVPLIVWLLQEGHVPTDAYLRWASEHYELPLLNSAYFSEVFDASQARNIQADVQDEWRPWHFPVEQWDGVTLVTCVEPPTGQPAGHVRYVLADPNVLAENWSKITEMESGSVIMNEAAPPPIPDVPVGFNETTGTKPFKLNLDLGNADLFSAPSEGEAPAVAEAPLIAEAPPVPETPAIPEIVIAEPAPKPVAAKPTAKAKAPAPAPPPAPAPASAPGETTITLAAAMSELQQIFEHVFILKCSGGTARLYKWDSSMKPTDGGKNIQVDLAFPTFLRIVHKTGMPYHGYLVDSPAHNDFFASLKLERPGCVTAVPVKHNGDLVGVLVGTGNEELQKLDVLSRAEVMATKLTGILALALAEAA